MKNKLFRILSLIATFFCFVSLAVAQSTATQAPATTGFFSPENLVGVMIGGLISVGATQYFKNKSGLAGFGAAFLTLIVSVVVATVAVIVSSLINGSFTWENVGSSIGSIFTLATLAYRLIPVQSQTSN